MGHGKCALTVLVMASMEYPIGETSHPPRRWILKLSLNRVGMKDKDVTHSGNSNCLPYDTNNRWAFLSSYVNSWTLARILIAWIQVGPRVSASSWVCHCPTEGPQSLRNEGEGVIALFMLESPLTYTFWIVGTLWTFPNFCISADSRATKPEWQLDYIIHELNVCQ